MSLYERLDVIWGWVFIPELLRRGVPVDECRLRVNPVYGDTDNVSIANALVEHARHIARMHGKSL